MTDIAWRSITRRELAVLLRNSPQVSSSAVGETTIYRLDNNGLEILALSLPDGATVIVEQVAAAAKRRRRVDMTGVTPASR